MLRLKTIICTLLIVQSVLLFTSAQCLSIDIEFDLIHLLGQKVDNKEVMKYMKMFNEKPIITNRYEKSFYYSFNRNGISFLFEKDVIDTIFLYSGEYEKDKQFKGTIPKGINWFDNSAELNKKLGPPSQSGRSEKIPGILKSTMNNIITWDKWNFHLYSLHIEYYNGGQIGMITLSQNTNE